MEALIIIALLVLMTAIILGILEYLVETKTKRLELEASKYHLKGELKVKSDGIYVGDVRIKGVSKCSINILSKDYSEANLTITILNNKAKNKRKGQL